MIALVATDTAVFFALNIAGNRIADDDPVPIAISTANKKKALGCPAWRS